MRKLLVGVLIAVFGVFALAGSQNVTVSWGGAVTVTAKLTKDGIDISGVLDSYTTYVSWGPTSSDEPAGKVTVSISWALPPAGLSLNSVKFDGDLLCLKFVNSGYEFGSALMDSYNYESKVSFEGDYLKLKVKALPVDLAFVYIDQVDPDGTETFFEDGVAALASFDLGVGSLSAGGVYYMSAGNGLVAAYADFTGKDALQNLTVNFGYKQDGEKYGILAKYSLSFGDIVTIAPELGYGENWNGLNKYFAAGITVEPKLGDNITLSLFTKPEYDLDASEFSAYLEANLGLTFSPVTLNGKFTMNDVVNNPDTWAAEAHLTVKPVDVLTLGADFTTDNTMAYTWDVYAEYTIEEGLTAKAYYDHTNDWYAQISYSASF